MPARRVCGGPRSTRSAGQNGCVADTGKARDPHEVAKFIERVHNPLPIRPPSWNIAPTHDALVLRHHLVCGERHLDALRWGLVPPWAKDNSVGAQEINARAETVATTPVCRDAFVRRRRLVPADGSYEWMPAATPKVRKQPFTVELRGGRPMALAGPWEGWCWPGGKTLRSITTITTAAVEPAELLVQPQDGARSPRSPRQWDGSRTQCAATSPG